MNILKPFEFSGSVKNERITAAVPFEGKVWPDPNAKIIVLIPATSIDAGERLVRVEFLPEILEEIKACLKEEYPSTDWILFKWIEWTIYVCHGGTVALAKTSEDRFDENEKLSANKIGHKEVQAFMEKNILKQTKEIASRENKMVS